MKIYLDGKFVEKKKPRSLFLTTAFYTATGFLKAFALTISASSGWMSTSSGCIIQRKLSILRYLLP